MRSRRQLVFAWFALFACSCSPDRSPSVEPDTRASPTPAVEDSSPPSQEQEPAAEIGPPPIYRFAWGTDTGDWVQAVAVVPSGVVLSSSRGELRVHASDDGRVLDQQKACTLVGGGLRVLDDSRALMVCDNGEIQQLTLPALARDVVEDLGMDVSHLSWGDGHMAVTGPRGDRVRVVDTTSWREVDAFNLPHSVEGLAIAPDGAFLAFGDEKGGVHIREVGTGSSRELTRVRPRSSAFALSSDQRRLFLTADSFEARVYDLDSAEILDAYTIGTWITEARWIDPDTVVGAGSDSLALYLRGSAEPQKLVDPGHQRTGYSRVGVSEDGSIVCAGTMEGRVSCFSTRPMPASTYGASAVQPHS